ncbi:MAG TPA: nucleoside deaminase [Acidimicrobiales bacterium]|nr:nucleoside deaminase [Acidimicrobiales bacterium]
MNAENALDYECMAVAVGQARVSLSEGGIPIGAALFKGPDLLGRGYNRRAQLRNPILHGEMDCLQNAGRVGSYRGTTMYSTLMPCYMCAGTIVQFRVPRVVVGESLTFPGGREFMEEHGVEVVDLEMQECAQMLQGFIAGNPGLWAEDIGEL